MSAPRLTAFLATMRERGEAPCIYWRGHEVSYDRLCRMASRWRGILQQYGIRHGQVVALRADYSPEACAALLALASIGAIAVPLPRTLERTEALLEIAGASEVIEIGSDEDVNVEPSRAISVPPLVDRVSSVGHGGLIVFTSGSTGEPKGILHDLERVLAKFERPRAPYRTLQFLLFDHFGGVNTLLGTLSSGGVVVIPERRSPAEVAGLVEAARVELLPVTPTFLTLLLASGVQHARDLSSVKLITYGTEPMPETTLTRLASAFPNARLQQTYGLSELGVLRSRSRDSGSLWVQVGGPGFDTRIIDGVLHVRSEFAMVGYLNAASPFDDEGWMNTGDIVEQDDEWLRIRGRASDLINVGGQKVFPAEVEDVLASADNVVDAVVHGEAHPLLGSIVVARVVLSGPEDDDALLMRLRQHCRERLAAFKVPMKIEASVSGIHGDRFKKARRTR